MVGWGEITYFKNNLPGGFPFFFFFPLFIIFKCKTMLLPFLGMQEIIGMNYNFINRCEFGEDIDLH